MTESPREEHIAITAENRATKVFTITEPQVAGRGD
jgi:hypothetical protein